MYGTFGYMENVWKVIWLCLISLTVSVYFVQLYMWVFKKRIKNEQTFVSVISSQSDVRCVWIDQSKRISIIFFICLAWLFIWSPLMDEF